MIDAHYAKILGVKLFLYYSTTGGLLPSELAEAEVRLSSAAHSLALSKQPCSGIATAHSMFRVGAFVLVSSLLANASNSWM